FSTLLKFLAEFPNKHLPNAVLSLIKPSISFTWLSKSSIAYGKNHFLQANAAATRSTPKTRNFVQYPPSDSLAAETASNPAEIDASLVTGGILSVYFVSSCNLEYALAVKRCFEVSCEVLVSSTRSTYLSTLLYSILTLSVNRFDLRFSGELDNDNGSWNLQR
ncbi:hypothetical protein V5O48_019146, partial [Marasmius crinis-equi]